MVLRIKNSKKGDFKIVASTWPRETCEDIISHISKRYLLVMLWKHALIERYFAYERQNPAATSDHYVYVRVGFEADLAVHLA